MQRLEVSGAVRPIYGSLGVKRLTNWPTWSRVPQVYLPLSKICTGFLYLGEASSDIARQFFCKSCLVDFRDVPTFLFLVMNVPLARKYTEQNEFIYQKFDKCEPPICCFAKYSSVKSTYSQQA